MRWSLLVLGAATLQVRQDEAVVVEATGFARRQARFSPGGDLHDLPGSDEASRLDSQPTHEGHEATEHERVLHPRPISDAEQIAAIEQAAQSCRDRLDPKTGLGVIASAMGSIKSDMTYDLAERYVEALGELGQQEGGEQGASLEAWWSAVGGQQSPTCLVSDLEAAGVLLRNPRFCVTRTGRRHVATASNGVAQTSDRATPALVALELGSTGCKSVLDAWRDVARIAAEPPSATWRGRVIWGVASSADPWADVEARARAAPAPREVLGELEALERDGLAELRGLNDRYVKL